MTNLQMLVLNLNFPERSEVCVCMGGDKILKTGLKPPEVDRRRNKSVKWSTAPLLFIYTNKTCIITTSSKML